MIVVIIRVTFLHTGFKATNELERIVVGIEVDVADDLILDTGRRGILRSIASGAD